MRLSRKVFELFGYWSVVGMLGLGVRVFRLVVELFGSEGMLGLLVSIAKLV